MQQNEIEQELNVEIKHNSNSEFLIADNIAYFEELAKNGININFRYQNAEKNFPLQEILRMEQFMQSVADDIKSKNFSPLEQLIAVYDISKVFKPYEKDVKADDKRNFATSRALYEYLDNEYMVCAGYTDLISNLAHRLNLPCSEVYLQTKKEGHARNYVNIVDSKYGVDGMYVLEPTWEQDGTMPKTQIEEYRSTYKEFLLTTEQGRAKDISLDWDKYGGYDVLCTMQSPQEVREYFESSSYAKEWYNRMSILDPEFYKKMVTLDLKKDEDANVLIEYFRTKINNLVPKEKLLDAIMEVKKSIYVNLTEQDFEDMRMSYSISEPFSIFNELCQEESLYGEEYNEYLKRRYEDIKSKTLIQAKEENSCLDVEKIYKTRLNDIIQEFEAYGFKISNGKIIIENQEVTELVDKYKEKIESTGLSYSEHYNFVVGAEQGIEFNVYNCESNKDKLEMTLEQRIEILQRKIEQLCEIIGRNKEVATQKLGKETLDEQNDTTGKIETLDEIQRQMHQQIKKENNHESK